IKSAMDAVLVKDRSSGAFRRVGYIVERKSDDPFVGWQAERAQRKPATDAVVQPNGVPFQTSACPLETIHFRHCPQLPKLFQTSLALACKRNPKTATMIQNHSAPPF